MRLAREVDGTGRLVPYTRRDILRSRWGHAQKCDCSARLKREADKK